MKPDISLATKTGHFDLLTTTILRSRSTGAAASISIAGNNIIRPARNQASFSNVDLGGLTLRYTHDG